MVLSTARSLTLDDPVLDRIADEESRRWVQHLLEQLATDGRLLEGGWPGTLSEARRLVAARITSEANRRAMRAFTRTEFDRLVKVVYGRARVEWLARIHTRTRL